jgi:hypothetical protein
MPRGQDDTEGHRETVDIPGHDQEGKADAEQPRVMVTCAALLGQRVFARAFVFVAAITDDGEDTIVWSG